MNFIIDTIFKIAEILFVKLVYPLWNIFFELVLVYTMYLLAINISPNLETLEFFKITFLDLLIVSYMISFILKNKHITS